MQDEKIISYAALLKKSVESGTLRSVVFHSPENNYPKDSEKLKAKGKIKSIGGKTVLQI